MNSEIETDKKKEMSVDINNTKPHEPANMLPVLLMDSLFVISRNSQSAFRNLHIYSRG